MSLGIGLGSSSPDDQINGPESVQNVPPPSSDTSPTSASSIQASELQAGAMAILAAGIPLLEPPTVAATSFSELAALSNVKSSSMGALIAAEKSKNDIITSLWDNYDKMLKQIADDYKESEKRKDLYPELSASEQARLTLQQWMGGTFAVSMSGTLAGGVGDVRNLVSAVSSDGMDRISVSPFADAVAGVGGPLSGLPMDTQAACALVAALLNGNVVSRTNIEILSNSLGKKPPQPPQDLDFAIQYTNNILAMVIPQIDKGAGLSPERASLNRSVRLTLATMALNLLYRTIYGGMNGLEMKELLQADPKNLANILKFPDSMPEALQAKLTSLMRQLLSQIQGCFPDDPAKKQNLIENIAKYVNQKDSVSSMLATTQMFRSYLSDVGSDIQA